MSAENRIVSAISVPGRAPRVHEQQIARLAVEWPTLARALADLLDEHGAPVPPAWWPLRGRQ